VDNHKIQEFLGVDVGDKRVGIALGNTAARIAHPLKTVDASQAIEELTSLAESYSVAGIVVGLPRGMQGNETAQTQKVRHWADQAKLHLNQPLFWQDETLTSVAAQSERASKKRPLDIDAEAAALILQDFLNSNENDRVAV
jgi:putative Holliday junction resolvase